MVYWEESIVREESNGKIFVDYKERLDLYQSFSDKVQRLLEHLIREKGISPHSITSRIKDERSLRDKLKRKNFKYENVDQVTDLIGIRIITYFQCEVETIAAILEEEFDVDKENTINKKDVIEADRFGYLSLHYVVRMSRDRLRLPEYRGCRTLKAEIQIRTILQHAWAEIEHDLGYKNTDMVPQNIRRDFYRLAGLLELADKEFMEIRGTLKKCRSNAKEKVTAGDHKIPIDSVSLEDFIGASETLRRLNNDISCVGGAAIVKNDNRQSIAKSLRHAGFEVIEDISGALEKDYDLCLFMARKMIADSFPLSDETALQYLCYAKLVKTEMPQPLVAYWQNTLGLNFHPQTRFVTEANRLISIYEDYLGTRLETSESPSVEHPYETSLQP